MAELVKKPFEGQTGLCGSRELCSWAVVMSDFPACCRAVFLVATDDTCCPAAFLLQMDIHKFIRWSACMCVCMCFVRVCVHACVRGLMHMHVCVCACA